MPQPSASSLALFLILALLAGVATAFQPGVNARFADLAGHRIHGGVINFAVGCLAMLIVWFIASRFFGVASPQPSRLAQGPWWMWTGGLLGAFFVTTAVALAPRVGAANYLAAMIAGQLVASLIIDHFGLLGLPQISITPWRVAGIALMLGGLALIKFG
jgi:transporter family-2 protein